MKTLLIITFLLLSACQAPDNSVPNDTSGPTVTNTDVDPDTEVGTVPVYDSTISSLQNGNFIYENSHEACSYCHGYFGEGQSNGLAIQSATFAQLDAALTAHGNGMPTYNLSDEQKAALYEYIQSFTAQQ